MKILMLLDHEFPTDIRVENEIQSLSDGGHEVHIACFTKMNRDEYEKTNDCVIHRKTISGFVHKTSVGALRFSFYFNFWRKFLNKLFANESFDAIHVHDLPLARVGYEFSQKFNTKFVLDLHENWPALLEVATHVQSVLGKFLSKNRQWEEYEKKYCKLADKVIVVIDEAKERIASLGVDPSKIIIVSNTLNLDEFEIPTEKPDPNFITLLYAGGINKHRGLQHIIKGIKYINFKGHKLRLWILGSGSYVTELKELALQEEVAEKVFFLGWKSYTEMQELFGKSDYCLIPHLKNDHTDSTIPHKIFQYMYAGKPMIVSNCNPIKRIVEKTNSGLVYRFDDPEDFNKKLHKMVENKYYSSEEFISRNKQFVVEDYNWLDDSQRLNLIYK